MKYLISLSMSIALGASGVATAVTATHYKHQATPNPELQGVQFQKHWQTGDLLDLSGLEWGIFEGDITVSKNFYLANQTLQKFETNLIHTLCQTQSYYSLLWDMTDTDVYPGLPQQVADTLKQSLAFDWGIIQQNFAKTAPTGNITLPWFYALHGYYSYDVQTKGPLVRHGSQFGAII